MFSKVVMNNKRISVLSISVASILFSINSYALTPEQYQQQRSEALKQQQIPNPSINIDTQAYQDNSNHQLTSQKADTPCFDIHNLYLIGEQSEHFSFATVPYTQGSSSIIGQCMTAQTINQLATNVQNRIIEKGYVTSRVLIENQNLKTGNLFLTIIPGRIDQIIPAGSVNGQNTQAIYIDKTGNPANFAAAMPMQTGELLNIRDIEQTLENFKRVPTAEADFSITPSQRINAPGYSDIQVKWQQNKKWRIAASIDDSGQDSTGKYQGSVTVSLDNPTWHNDLLYASYNRSLDGSHKQKGSWGYNIGYTLPIDYTQLNLSHSGYNYDQRVAGVNQDYIYSGESYNTEATLSHLVHRDSHSKTYLKVGGYSKQQQNYIDDTEVEVQRRKTAGYKTGITHETSLGGTQLITDITYQRGTAAFNALTPPEALFNEGDTRVGIYKANIDINHPMSLGTQKLNYHATIKGQYANESLVPNDRFSIGGRYSVHGFDGKRSLSGDQGALVRQELSTNFANTPHAIYAGIDAGYVKMDNDEQNDLLLGHHLVGGVVGFKGYIAALHTSYDLFAGYPLAQPDGFSDKQWVTGFNLGWQY